MLGVAWMMVLLCATWVLAFFYISSPSTVLEFIFVIVNSFQGVLILFFYLITYRQILFDFAMYCRRSHCLPAFMKNWGNDYVSSATSDSSNRFYNASSNGRSDALSQSNSSPPTSTTH